MRFRKLPFVQSDGNGQITSTWAVTACGDYAEDCATGRKYFRDLLLEMNLSSNQQLLPRVLRGQAMVLDKWGGIEVGFHQALSIELLASA